MPLPALVAFMSFNNPTVTFSLTSFVPKNLIPVPKLVCVQEILLNEMLLVLGPGLSAKIPLPAFVIVFWDITTLLFFNPW
jgi:hypothetical protein